MQLYCNIPKLIYYDINNMLKAIAMQHTATYGLFLSPETWNKNLQTVSFM